MGKRKMEIEVRIKVPLVVVSRICRSGRRVCLSDCDREHRHKISIEDGANNAVFFSFLFSHRHAFCNVALGRKKVIW